MTLKEGLPLIAPSPYGEQDEHLLARFDAAERHGDSIRVLFQLVFYTNIGMIYNDNVSIGRDVSFDALVGWLKGRKRKTSSDVIRPDELDLEGYELYDVHKLYQRFQHEISQVKGPEA